MNQRIRALTGLTIAATLGACAVDAQDDGAERDWQEPSSDYTPATSALVAQVNLEDGASVQFFEPQPGYLIMSATDRIGRHSIPAQQDGETMVDYYERLAQSPAPAALVDADRRRTELLVSWEREPTLRQPRSDEPVSAPQPAEIVDKAWADDSQFWPQCGTSWVDLSHYRLATYRQVTGTGTLQYDDVITAWAGAMNLDGPTIRATFKIRPWYTWSPGVYSDLPKGYYITFTDGWNQAKDFDAKISMSNSASSVFDVCLRCQYKYY